MNGRELEAPASNSPHPPSARAPESREIVALLAAYGLTEEESGPVVAALRRRPSIAASLLERSGRRDVVNVKGGWAAYRARECAEPDPQDLFCQALFDRRPVAA